MPKVFAAVQPHGFMSSFASFNTEREITDDLPADIIGECIVEATQKAWRAGFDPALPPFVVIVSFK